MSWPVYLELDGRKVTKFSSRTFARSGRSTFLRMWRLSGQQRKAKKIDGRWWLFDHGRAVAELKLVERCGDQNEVIR